MNKSEAIEVFNSDIEKKRLIYGLMIAKLQDYYGEDFQHDANSLRELIREWRQNELRFFREWIVSEINEELPEADRISWRDLKISYKRFKCCEICGHVYYDVSRNNKTKVCYSMPYLRANHTALFRDGSRKSACWMERDAKRKRAAYNKERNGIAHDGYTYRIHNELNDDYSGMERKKPEGWIPYEIYREMIRSKKNNP